MAKLTVDELKTALKDEAGFTDEQLTGLTKPQLEKLADGYMRQTDYNREMNAGKAELTAKQTALDEANQRLNAEMAEWATIQANGGQATEQQKKDVLKAQAQVDRLTAAVKDLSTRAGVNPDDILASVTTGGPDLSGYVKVTDIDRLVNERIGGVAQMSLRLPAVLSKIARDHHKLTGADLDENAIISEIEKRAQTRGNTKPLDPVQVWEELHDIPAKRIAAEEQRVNALVSAAEARGREAAMSEVSIPGSHTPAGRHAVVFNSGERKSVLSRPQPGGTTSAALAALRSGKYRPGNKTA